MGWAPDLTKAGFQGQAARIAARDAAKLAVVSPRYRRAGWGRDPLEGQAAGHVSMAIPSPILGGQLLALARIAKAHAGTGTVVSALGQSGALVAMPVHDPKRRRARS